MKLLVEMKDKDAGPVLRALKQFQFVKVKKLEDRKQEILRGLNEAIEEVKLARKGKIKLKSAEELLREL